LHLLRQERCCRFVPVVQPALQTSISAVHFEGLHSFRVAAGEVVGRTSRKVTTDAIRASNIAAGLTAGVLGSGSVSACASARVPRTARLYPARAGA
jgi:hypothetical protein